MSILGDKPEDYEIDLNIEPTEDDAIPDRMNGPELRTLAWIEQYWEQHGKFPTDSMIKQHCPVDINVCLQKVSFKYGLTNRGIVIGQRGILSPEQIACVQVLTNFADRRTINAKLRSLGIRLATYRGWMKDEFFRNFILNSSSEDFKNASLLAKDGLYRAMEKGDTNAVKLYLELTGQYKSGQQDNTDFAQIIVKLLEIMARHLTPDKMAAIEDDFGKEISMVLPVQRSRELI